MNLYKLSFYEALRNLRQHIMLNTMVVLVLSVSISIFIASIEIITAIDTDSLNYNNPQQLKYIHLKDLSKDNTFFESKENHVSPGIIKQFVHYFDNPAFAQTTFKLYKISPHNNHEVSDERVDLVSYNFFKVLGVVPYKGTVPDYNKSEIAISFDMWKSTYNQKDVINNSIIINNTNYTISAILPSQFRTPNSYKSDAILQKKSKIWMPIANEIDMFENNTMALLFLRSLDSTAKLNQDVKTVYSKIKDLDKYSKSFSIQTGNLIDLIYGVDTKNSLYLLLFSVFLLIISVISILILLSTNTNKSVQQIALKRMLGACTSTSFYTKNLEYLVVVAIIIIIAIPFVWYFKSWLDHLDFLHSLAGQSIAWYIKLLIMLCVAFVLYAILILTPLLKVKNIQLIDAIKGNFNSKIPQFWAHHLLLFLQAIVAVVLFYIAYTLILNTYKNYRNLNRLNLNQKLSIQVNTNNTNSQEIYQKAIELKQQLNQINGIDKVVIATASPLELVGMLMTLSSIYHNPKDVQKMGKDSFMVLNPEAIASSFKVSIIHVEKEFFNIFDIRFLRGKNFSDNDNEVILVNEQLENIFGGNLKKPEIGEYIPASPIVAEWQTGIVLGGVINNISVFENNYIAAFLQTFNLAFKVLNFNTTKGIMLNRLSFILVSNDINAIDPQRLKALVAQYPNYFELTSIYNLKDQAKSIIAKNSAKTISALFLALVSLLLILFGSIGLVNSICTKMYKEIGIRLTVGAKDYEIVKMILGKILIPSILGVAIPIVILFLINGFIHIQDVQKIVYFIPIAIILIVIITLSAFIPLRKLIIGSVSEFINVVN